MYLVHTRLNIAYAPITVSQFMHNHGVQHMNADMCILKYLKVVPIKGILFTKNVYCQSLDTYNDVDWARAINDNKSTSGYFTFVEGSFK